MKKRVLQIAVLVFVVGGSILTTQESEAIDLQYKLTTTLGADGCTYHFCSNTSGDSCNMPGALSKICDENNY